MWGGYSRAEEERDQEHCRSSRTSCKARPPSCHLQVPQHPTSDLRRDSEGTSARTFCLGQQKGHQWSSQCLRDLPLKHH